MDLEDFDESIAMIQIGGAAWKAAPLRLSDLLELRVKAENAQLTSDQLLTRGSPIKNVEQRVAYFTAAYREMLREANHPSLLLERYLCTWGGFKEAVRLSLLQGDVGQDVDALFQALETSELNASAILLRRLWSAMGVQPGNCWGRRG